MLKNIGENNIAVIANAAELATTVVQKVAGNAIADTVGGQPLTDVLADTIVAKLGAKVAPHLGE